MYGFPGSGSGTFRAEGPPGSRAPARGGRGPPLDMLHRRCAILKPLPALTSRAFGPPAALQTRDSSATEFSCAREREVNVLYGDDRVQQLFRNPRVVLVSGYARLPDSVASHSQYQRLGVILAVDTADGRIMAADTTLLTDLAKDFFRALVEGASVTEDITELIRRVKTR